MSQKYMPAMKFKEKPFEDCKWE